MSRVIAYLVILAIVALSVVVVLQATTSGEPSTIGAQREILVYTYSDFMAWGPDKEKAWSIVFEEFENATGIRVKVRTFDGAREMLLTLIQEARRGLPTADVVIGVDNILVYEAKKNGVLDCYLSPVASIPRELIEALDPEGCVTPFDYGLIAIVYDPSRLPTEIVDRLRQGFVFEDFALDPELARMLIVEDPTKSSTGLSFLLLQIAVYEKLLGLDWREWWRSVREHVYVAPSWSSAYDVFFSDPTKPIVVSYGTDPAYSAYESKGEPTLEATVIRVGGDLVGWLQVEGVMLVKGTRDREAATKFIDWLVSKRVQDIVAINQWMLPANMEASIPDFFRYALTVDDVDIVANTLLTPEEIATKLEDWLTEWTRIMAGG